MKGGIGLRRKISASDRSNVASIRRKLLKTTHAEERIASIQIQKVATFNSDSKLIPNKSFGYQ